MGRHSIYARFEKRVKPPPVLKYFTKEENARIDKYLDKRECKRKAKVIHEKV